MHDIDFFTNERKIYKKSEYFIYDNSSMEIGFSTVFKSKFLSYYITWSIMVQTSFVI